MTNQPEPQPADLENEAVPDAVTPAWLADDPCPAWCAGDHPLDEHPEDRAHVSEVVDVPVIAKGRRWHGRQVPEPLLYIVAMRRYAGETETWVCIGDGQDGGSRLDVTVESARRVATTTLELIDAAFV